VCSVTAKRVLRSLGIVAVQNRYRDAEAERETC